MEVHRELYGGKYWVEIWIPGLGFFFFYGLTRHEADEKANKFLKEHKEYR